MDHWTPFYQGDYIRDTRHLSQGEHGAYILLLTHYWATEKPLPLDKKELYRIGSAQNAQEKRNILKVLGQFFTQVENGHMNKKCEEILEAKRSKRKTLSENGKKGGLAKAKANAIDLPPQMPKHNQIHNHILPTEEFINSPPTKSKPDEKETEFETWWKEYPRKEAKKNTKKAYWVARKTVSAEVLIEGLARYRAGKPHYADWKVPTTWLNGEHWNDEAYKPGYTEPPSQLSTRPMGSNIPGNTILAGHQREGGSGKIR